MQQHYVWERQTPKQWERRFTRANVKHPTYQALGELGKVIKTIFLCRYLHSEELRREINEGLNVVENWNSTNNFIFYGKSGEIATNQPSEQLLAVLSLHLLQVCLGIGLLIVWIGVKTVSFADHTLYAIIGYAVITTLS